MNISTVSGELSMEEKNILEAIAELQLENKRLREENAVLLERLRHAEYERFYGKKN